MHEEDPAFFDQRADHDLIHPSITPGTSDESEGAWLCRCGERATGGRNGTLLVVHTHRITISGDVVRKVYVSWDRDEPVREWVGLTTLTRHVPALGADPDLTRSRGRPVPP